MKNKIKHSWRHLLLYLLWFVVGLLLGYYLGYDHGWEKVVESPYHAQEPTTPPACDAITNISPTPGSKVTSPLTISITVDNTKTCKWVVFEAQAGVALLEDSTGKKIGSATLTTTEEWMTEQPVVYTGTIEFGQTPDNNELLLVIYEENPAGRGEENGQSITIPLKY